ncbi:MAG: aminotransferase class I/II-fold pyridoxal phosphate-dependent enzyme [Bacteroidota bacterium]
MSFSLQKCNSVDHLDCTAWDGVVSREGVAQQTNHLRAIEYSGINDIKPYYLTISQDGAIKALASYFIMEMDFSGFSSSISPVIRKSLKQWFPNFLVNRILECGIISGIGKTIEVSEDCFDSLTPIIIKEIEADAEKNKADIILIRDIPWDRVIDYYGILQKFGYEPIFGFPSPILRIEGDSIEDYLNSLKSQRRDYVKKIQAKLRVPEISVEVMTDFGKYATRLSELTEQVSKNADEYEHEKLTPAYFYEIDRCLSDKSYVIVIKADNEIVAHALCLEGDSEVFMAYVGIDYKYNQKYQLYFNLYFLVIEEALKRHKRIINFGITTYDFKLLIGCELEPLIYFVKHYAQPDLTLALAKLLTESIKQPENTHRAFKNVDTTRRAQIKTLESELETLIYGKKNLLSKARLYTRIDKLRFCGVYSFFPPFESAQKEYVQYQGKKLIMLGSNSYMGLGSHPEVCAAAKEAIDKYGTGCSGSPLMNGTLDIHLQLENDLAKFMNKEKAILFSTGYQTNLGVIAALAGRHDLLILDSLNHASIFDAAKFSYADVERYLHDDMDSLEKILCDNVNRNKLIVADSVFSMEGTMANIPEIVRLAKKYNASIFLDEAHGIGVLGPNGRGAAEHFGLLDQIDIVMGTFSKSFAAVGGFVAADARVIDYLHFIARPHIFSASMPPSVAATVKKALEIIIREPERRTKVIENAKYMAEGLISLGYDARFSNTAVVPIYCGDELLTLGLFRKLIDEGVYVNPVLSPAVPKGKELLRTSYMAIHDKAILDQALAIFEKVRTPYFPLRQMA